MELWMLVPALAAFLVGVWVGSLVGWNYGEERVFGYFGGR